MHNKKLISSTLLIVQHPVESKEILFHPLIAIRRDISHKCTFLSQHESHLSLFYLHTGPFCFAFFFFLAYLDVLSQWLRACWKYILFSSTYVTQSLPLALKSPLATGKSPRKASSSTNVSCNQRSSSSRAGWPCDLAKWDVETHRKRYGYGYHELWENGSGCFLYGNICSPLHRNMKLSFL